MKKNQFWKTILVLTVTIISVGVFSCKDDDDDKKGGEESAEITENDPEGTIITNLQNTFGPSGNGYYENGISTFMGYEDDHYLGMNSANNLEAQGREHLAQIISIGKVKGLSHINNIPESGWSNQVAAIPGYGYIYRVSWWNYTPISYARIFVVNYITSTSGGIIGATIKYQPYWEPETK